VRSDRRTSTTHRAFSTSTTTSPTRPRTKWNNRHRFGRRVSPGRAYLGDSIDRSGWWVANPPPGWGRERVYLKKGAGRGEVGDDHRRMRVVCQRVSEARVSIEGAIVGEIDLGLVVLLGVERDDR